MKNIIKIIFMSSVIFSSAWLSNSKNITNYITNKGIVNHVDDEDYTYLCGDNESNLTVIEDEDNMMNPNNLNITKGKVSLKNDMKLTINDEAYYTFVIFLSDAYDVRNVNFGTGNCIRLDYSPVTIDNQIETFTIEDDATSGSTPTELFNNGSTNRLNLYTENFNQLFIEFYIPRTESYCRRVQISSFCFGFNTSGSCGTIEHVQLYKSQMNLDKPWSEYNHEPCGITDDAGGPYKDGYKYYLALNYKSDLTIEDLQNSLMAYDFGDGQYHDVELVTDNYTNNRNTLETDLEVVFSATDSRGNTSTFTYCIVISDNVAPSITQLNESINFSYEEELTQQKLLACFSFSDNYLDQIDSTQIQNFNFDLEDNFVGTFTFTVEAKDISGNICLLDSSANMIDDVAPVISGEDEIVIKAGDVLTNEDILSHYTAFDEIDGETYVEIKNNGLTGNTNNIGLYTCEIESKDSSNNIALKTIFLQVTDSDGPSFYVNESTITQYGTHMISSDEIIQSLVKTNQLPEKNYVYSEFLYGNYKGENGEISIGTYSERVSAHADDGSVEYSNVTIVVKSIKDSETNSKTSFWSTLLSWFSNLWKSICQFFANLFNF